MTRFLSESLSALEPRFGSGLHSLEAAHGRSGVDIRFSLEAEQATKRKISELELDPEDTTAEELYHALNLRLKIDDYLLTKRLRTLAATKISAEADPVDGIIEAIKSLPESKSCFAIKSASLKSLLSELPPKKAMKTLGYRSLASISNMNNRL